MWWLFETSTLSFMVRLKPKMHLLPCRAVVRVLITRVLILAHSGRRADRLWVPTRHEQSSEKQGKENGQARGQTAVQGHGPEREEVPSHVQPLDLEICDFGTMKSFSLSAASFELPSVECATMGFGCSSCFQWRALVLQLINYLSIIQLEAVLSHSFTDYWLSWQNDSSNIVSFSFFLFKVMTALKVNLKRNEGKPPTSLSINQQQSTKL